MDGKGRARIGEDGGSIAPAEHEIEEDAECGGDIAGPYVVRRYKANTGHDPHGPRRQAVDEDKGEEGNGGAAVALDLTGPAAAAHGSHRGYWWERGRAQRGHGYDGDKWADMLRVSGAM